MTDADEPIHYADYQDEHLTYRSLWHAARRLYEAGLSNESSGLSSILAATLFVFTAYEGFTNDLLERVAPEVAKQNTTVFRFGGRSGTLGKTLFLADRLSLPVSRQERT